MTIVYGQIESLTRIRETLDQKGIRRFNSLGDINIFKRTYEIERKNVSDKAVLEINSEINMLQSDKNKFEGILEELKREESKKISDKIKRLKDRHDLIKSRFTKNILTRIWNWLNLKILNFKITRLERNFDSILQRTTKSAEELLQETNEKILYYTSNKEMLISKRSSPKLRELAYTKGVIEGIYPLIAGAIGENLVEKELKKLSDKNILFNDFSIDFNYPIYNKKENDRIFSIQIDHLLVTNAGVFIIETKNWSRKSIESLDLRSPVKQITRTSYALFVILNSDSQQQGIGFNRHHWGDKQLPIRNIIAMINEKPKERFKYVQVKNLTELNSYINYFDPIFDDNEVERISEYLRMIKN